MADQTEPVKRRVALKIIKPGMDTRQVIARFEAERQALAMMDHPNIARVLDAGTTDSGRPYFVMELVKGVPITQFCDEEHLTPRERLELFVPVCHALQHAHQKGVIHRDIKPSNVLVAKYDDHPVPKVIDFGVAKATERHLTEKTVFTQFGQILGTVDYMSPEQAELNQLDIDTRSDIYSSGVLLYELLAGETPFDRQRLRSAAFDELLKIIREEEPPRPSLRLSGSHSLPSIAANWHTEPKKLSALVCGELDWIVMKALEKDRTRRYETANGFAADIKRYLTDEPVDACPPSASYLLRKFVRRNKTAFVVGAVVATALVVGLGVAAWQSVRATLALSGERAARATVETERAEVRKQRDEAQLQRLEAIRQRDLAKQHRYFAVMRQAHQDWLNGQIARLHKVLGSCVPTGYQPDLRGWEWYYLLSLCHRDLLTLRGHADLISAVAWSPDGRFLASASFDRAVKIWDSVSGNEIRTLSGPAGEKVAWSKGVAWSYDGRYVASPVTKSTAVVIWDVANGKEVRTLRGHSRPITSVAWSPDSCYLASGSADTTAKIWDLATGAEIHTLRGHTERILSVSWSPDGRWLATTGDSEVKIWEAVTGQEVRAFRGHTGERGASTVAWSPDARRLASGTLGDFEVKIWEPATGQEQRDLPGIDGSVRSVAWSPDGRRLAAATFAGSITISDALTGELIRTLRGHTDGVDWAAWSPDGGRLASGSRDRTIKLWDPNRDPEVCLLRMPTKSVTAVAWSPDGNHLASSGGDVVAVWDVARKEVVHTLAGHSGECMTIAWSSNGEQLASADAHGVIKVWNAHTGNEHFSLSTQNDALLMLAWSPDDRCLASSGENGLVTIWDLTARKELHSLQGHTSEVRGLAWSPDGTHLASSAKYPDWTVKIWDPTDGRQVASLSGVEHGALAWSPDGRHLAFANREIKVWDAAKAEITSRMEGHTGSVMSLAWHPDGLRLASLGEEHTVKIWDAVAGQEIIAMDTQVAWNCGGMLAWSPDGYRLAAASDDSTIKIWDASRGRQMAAGPEYLYDKAHRLTARGRVEKAQVVRQQLNARFPDARYDASGQLLRKLDGAAREQEENRTVSKTQELLPQNPVGFPSHCRLFDHAEELFREVGHGDERFEFRGDLLGNILSFSEGVAESIDIDFSEDFFEGCFSTEQDPHVGGMPQVSDQRGFGQYRAKHAA